MSKNSNVADTIVILLIQHITFHILNAHLQYPLLYFIGILSIDDVVFEVFIVNFLCLLLVGEHQQSFVVFAEDVVDVDTDENLYL